MAEVFDGSDVVKVQTPGAVEGIKLGVNWTGDRQLSSIDLHFDFVVSQADDTKLGEGRLGISDGSIGQAIDKVYTKLEAEATTAGYEPGNDDWPVRPEVTNLWNAAKALIGDGTETTPAVIAQLVASKNWGQWMLKREWAKSAVVEE